MCNTHTDNKVDTKTRRRRAVTLTDYYEKETMFILSLTSASIYNSAPVLDSQTQVNIMEDSGNLYNLFIKYLDYDSQSYIHRKLF